MQGCIRIFVLGCFVFPALTFTAPGGGYGGGLESSAPKRSPEEMAISAYNAGVELRDDALEYEQEASAQTDEKKRQKLLAKAQKSYTKAGKKFEKAVKYNPELYQAWSGFGHALRKTGVYDKSLEAYQKALKLNPDYYEAIEYQAEAHLYLRRFDSVKTAYARLQREHPEYAAKLLQEIHKWLPVQDASGAALKAFSAWAGQQQ